jgi:thiol-disulfide isomerase/thioredoxin
LKSADIVTLTVYSRNYCHLCDEMIAGLRELQARFRFELRVLDVDADPLLEQRYGEKVPLLAHGEVELCQYFLEAGTVTAHLSKFR